MRALTERGDASLNPIAKRAGVANATLYRHFPTRESLVLAVYRREVSQLVEPADQSLSERAPADALGEWVARLARYAITKHGLADALRAASAPGAALFTEPTSRSFPRWRGCSRPLRNQATCGVVSTPMT